MPLSGILAAEIFDHGVLSREVMGTLLPALGILMILILGCLMEPATCLLGVVALIPVMDQVFLEGGLHYQEAVLSLFILLVGGALVWSARSDSIFKTFFLACSIGGSLLFRSTLFLMPPLLALLEWSGPNKISASRAKRCLILLITPYLFLVPWIIMNWRVSRQIIPFENGASASNIAGAALGFVETTLGGLPQFVGDLGQTLIYRWAAGEILAHPGRYALGYMERLRYVLSLQPLLLFFSAFLTLWLNRKRRDIALLGVLAIYFIGIHCLMAVERRYFQPIWPILALLAAALLFKPLMKDGLDG